METSLPMEEPGSFRLSGSSTSTVKAPKPKKSQSEPASTNPETLTTTREEENEDDDTDDMDLDSDYSEFSDDEEDEENGEHRLGSAFNDDHYRSCANCWKIERDEDSTFQTCVACPAVVYCSVACQTEDWKTHQKFCVCRGLTSSFDATDPVIETDPEGVKRVLAEAALQVNDTEALDVLAQPGPIDISDIEGLQTLYQAAYEASCHEGMEMVHDMMDDSMKRENVRVLKEAAVIANRPDALKILGRGVVDANNSKTFKVLWEVAREAGTIAMKLLHDIDALQKKRNRKILLDAMKDVGYNIGRRGKLTHKHLNQHYSFLHELSEEGVFEILIDSFRLRVEDGAVLGGERFGLFNPSGLKHVIIDFRFFLDEAEKRKDFLPYWWFTKPQKRRECEKLALDFRGPVAISDHLNAWDVFIKYDDVAMISQLRMLAFDIYARPIFPKPSWTPREG